MTHVFTYGSLMFERIWTSVVRGQYESLHGTLYGFKRRSIRNEHYPALVPGPLTAAVKGILYLHIDDGDLRRLDSFEGSYYARKTVQVHTDNNIFQAEAYVLEPEYRHLVTDQDWDPDRFGDEGIDSFISTYFGFDR
ncbi:MAG: gamma-glutamylcyclotransferase [Desulfofustis sp.]|jgi:gamma-glutamylcyclotransferase (GGCT)/AIG2-like uncharacterized protein YtfP|nr:gamma-glutamylcyclotransferase [Desulfofustis sp.]